MGELLTRNTALLRQEVAAHVAADQVVQQTYWDAEKQRGCFIGCLTHSSDPQIAEERYGLPIMVQRIAESVFERLPSGEAPAFFAALPDAVQCDGKDLTKVGWQFLAAELRSLPPQSDEIQAVIDPVIAGIDRLASGMACDMAAVNAAAKAAAKAAGWAAQAAEWAALAAERAAQAAERAAQAAGWGALAVERAAKAAGWTAGAAAKAAAKAAADVAETATLAVLAAEAAEAAVFQRQRDLLLRLISEAEVRRG